MKRQSRTYLTLIYITVVLFTEAQCKNSKRAEIESELYKNVLPYVQIVQYDAAKAKEELFKNTKPHGKHKNKTKLLQELNKKVLPWLDEITNKVNAIANGKAGELRAELRKVHHHIKGPTALNTWQEEQVGQELASAQTSNEVIKQEEAGQLLEPQPNIQQLEDINKETQSVQLEHSKDTKEISQTQLKEIIGKKPEDQNQEIETEVAQLTNQIADFQEEINLMKNDPAQNPVRHKISKKPAKPAQKLKTRKHGSSGTVKIIFGGNVGFDGIVRYKVEAGICTYNESFNRIRRYLAKADHVAVNLDSVFQYDNESSILPDGKLAEDEAVKSFSYAGIDTVILANDHILDYGPEAATYTAAILHQKNTLFSGFTIGLKSNIKQEPVIYATNGVTIGLLSYCMSLEGCARIRNQTEVGPAVFNVDIVKEEVTALRESGIDVVIIYLHWGEEDNLMPADKIKEIIRDLSDVKIDAIVGSHPNIEGHYFFRGTLIMLSLGTFLTPMHIHIYKTKPGSKYTKLMDKLWDKQSERWELPSLNSKLLQMEVNRDGLVPFKSRYLPIRMAVNKNHCLQPERVPTEWWIPICTKRDKQCLGSSRCNELECGGIVGT